MSERKEDAQVVHIESTTRITINRGEHDGVNLGDKYLIYRLGPTIDDPETGESLGELEILVGRGKVIHPMDKMATLETESRTVTRRVRTIPSPFSGIAGVFGPREVVEETVPGEEFYDVERGDLARKID
ncbi:MAG: hypothetical protein KKB13_21255 [Chloroflexi bacterium]|nr:hypothetical protein [Chloroflexota bacterium]